MKQFVCSFFITLLAVSSAWGDTSLKQMQALIDDYYLVYIRPSLRLLSQADGQAGYAVATRDAAEEVDQSQWPQSQKDAYAVAKDACNRFLVDWAGAADMARNDYLAFYEAMRAAMDDWSVANSNGDGPGTDAAYKKLEGCVTLAATYWSRCGLALEYAEFAADCADEMCLIAGQ